MNIRNILNEIKYAHQRVRYGWDDRLPWGFEDYLRMIWKPLKEFCEEELQQENIKFNVKREEVFTKTLELIEKAENTPAEDYYKPNNAINKFWTYFGEHISYYWN